MIEKRKQALYARKAFDERGHTRLVEPRPGDWLFHSSEAGQDEIDFRKQCRNRRKRGRETIYMTELGGLSERSALVQERVPDYLGAFFGLEVVRRDPEPLPKTFYVRERAQYDGEALLDALARSLPADALASVAILDEDLFAEGLEFVFGLGSPSRRVGVYSFARFAEAASDVLHKKRCFRLVSHEVGHILGMEHCVYYRCLMNGMNSLEESDGQPLHLCPVCLAKLKWNVEFDDLAREQALVGVLSREGIADETQWSAERVARLAQP